MYPIIDEMLSISYCSVDNYDKSRSEETAFPFHEMDVKVVHFTADNIMRCE